MQPAPTLYADWQERRHRTNELAERDAPLRVLDYLLDRYRDDPLALKPARFPLDGAVFLNRRAMAVHRHLSFAPKRETRNADDASSKASRILQRIKSQAPQESVGAPAGGALVGDDSKNPSLLRVLLEMPLEKEEELRLVSEHTCYADSNDLHRLRLIHNDPATRVGAAYQLAHAGTLDDVNLLVELLGLPPEEMEPDDGIQEHYIIRNFDMLEFLVSREPPAGAYKILNESALLEECAMMLARRNHAT